MVVVEFRAVGREKRTDVTELRSVRPGEAVELVTSDLERGTP
jgi:hypothetical protein